MFTGLVHGQGEVTALERHGGQMRLRLRPLFALPDPRVGESMAVNGACLTLESWDASSGSFAVYASMETVSRTSLNGLRAGARVNLERALAVGDRLGGHLVSGHVDTVARVKGLRPAGDSRWCRLVFDPEWSAQIIPKGSVALDGISLTVNACGPGWLEVNVIPETWRVTTVSAWAEGHAVNLETDMIGKYVQHLLALCTRGGAAKEQEERSASAGVTLELLREHGFLGL
ncbi:MAG: riboflavin synthase [Desulfovibrionaceae bacterium]|nr:riboflavin synthase [Desulfovibrionaceae bacterium]